MPINRIEIGGNMDPVYHHANLPLDGLRDECLAYEYGKSAKLVHLQAADVAIPVGAVTKFNEGKYVSKGHAPNSGT